MAQTELQEHPALASEPAPIVHSKLTKEIPSLPLLSGDAHTPPVRVSFSLPARSARLVAALLQKDTRFSSLASTSAVISSSDGP